MPHLCTLYSLQYQTGMQDIKLLACDTLLPSPSSALSSLIKTQFANKDVMERHHYCRELFLLKCAPLRLFSLSQSLAGRATLNCLCWLYLVISIALSTDHRLKCEGSKKIIFIFYRIQSSVQLHSVISSLS